MTGTEIVQAFELWTDDTTELSPTESISLANRVTRKVYEEKPWEFLRKEGSDVVASSAVSVESDFDQFMPNYSEDGTSTTPDTSVVYIGTNRKPYFIVPYGSRYANTRQGNWCFYNPTTNKIEFVTAPTAGEAALYDYKHIPVDFAAGTSPTLPSNYHMMIVYGMLLENEVIQQSEKARSNRRENLTQYLEYMSNLSKRNARQFRP